MELVIGAAGQDMCRIIMLKYGLINTESAEICNYSEISGYCDGNICSKDELYGASIIDNFHEYVKRNAKQLDNKENMDELLLQLVSGDRIIIGNEIGCGIVPADKNDRDYRELYGRLMCRLSKEAIRVTRIVCGICQVIKGDK